MLAVMTSPRALASRSILSTSGPLVPLRRTGAFTALATSFLARAGARSAVDPLRTAIRMSSSAIEYHDFPKYRQSLVPLKVSCGLSECGLLHKPGCGGACLAKGSGKDVSSRVFSPGEAIVVPTGTGLEQSNLGLAVGHFPSNRCLPKTRATARN